MTPALARPGAPENLALSLFLLCESVMILRYVAGGDIALVDGALGLALLITGYRALTRPRARRTDLRPSTVTLALASTLLPFLYFALPAAQAPGALLQFAGAALIVTGLLFLGSSFAILPAARSLAQNGPYALIRHPIYAGYLLFDLAFVLALAHPAAYTIWFAEMALFVMRIKREENVLAGAEHAAYSERTRFRLVPGVW